MQTYETVFLAIASKNSFLTHDEAAACLSEYQSQASGPSMRSIEEIVQDRELLTAEQVRVIATAADKVAGKTAARPPSSSATPAARPPSSSTTRTVSSGKPNPNEPIPGVRISGKIGVGGTATVFLAEEVKSGRKMALKIIHPSLARDEKAVRRFQREASLLIDFDHANIVKGYSKGLMGPLSYFLMEFMEGESAQEALDREKQFPEARALEIILETAKAIEYMQSRGIVHRDIKPGNIFLNKENQIKVLDLGFAQDMSDGGAGEEEETTSGTAQYMSPEQARGAADLDVRADIYSLGATLYHMVMGELPFSGGDSLEVMAKQVMEALNSSGIKNRRFSRHMHYFIERMMSKDKDLRYATARELVDDITEQIEGFKSLEYRPEEEEPPSPLAKPTTRRIQSSSLEKHPTTRRFRPPARPSNRPPTTRKISKLDEYKSRFRKR